MYKRLYWEFVRKKSLKYEIVAIEQSNMNKTYIWEQQLHVDEAHYTALRDMKDISEPFFSTI